MTDLDDMLADAEAALADAIERKDPADIASVTWDLVNGRRVSAVTATVAFQPAEVEHELELAAQGAEKARETLAALIDGDAGDDETAAAALAIVEGQIEFLAGWNLHLAAMMAAGARQHKAAANLAADAAAAFRAAIHDYPADRTYYGDRAAMLSAMYEAIDKSAIFDLTGAKTTINGVRFLADDIQTRGEALLQDNRSRVVVGETLDDKYTAAMVTVYYRQWEGLAAFTSGEFKAAVDALQKAVDKVDVATAEFMSIGLPPELIARAQAESAGPRYYLNLAKAENAREHQRWDEAREALATAQDDIARAASYVKQSGLPNADATHDAFMFQAQLSISTLQRGTSREEQLSDALRRSEEHERELRVQVDVNVRVSVEARIQMKDDLASIVKTIEGLDLPADVKERLTKSGQSVAAAAPSDGESFMAKVKRFTGDVADVVKNTTDATKPLVPVLGALVPIVIAAL